MNAIILSAILGVIMMFSSVLVADKKAYKGIALIGLLILLIANICETYNGPFFHTAEYTIIRSFLLINSKPLN